VLSQGEESRNCSASRFEPPTSGCVFILLGQPACQFSTAHTYDQKCSSLLIGRNHRVEPRSGRQTMCPKWRPAIETRVNERSWSYPLGVPGEADLIPVITGSQLPSPAAAGPHDTLGHNRRRSPGAGGPYRHLRQIRRQFSCPFPARARR
jgi:hypothetical protein